MPNYQVDTPQWFETPRLKEYALEQMRGEHWGRALKALRVLQQRGEHEFVEQRFDFVIHYAALSDDILDGYTTPRPAETKELIFGPPKELGGIGDNLIYTVVPRAARLAGYEKVYLHMDHGLSDEIFQLIWGNKSPMDSIDGITDKQRTNSNVWAWDIIQSVYSPKRNLTMTQRICMSYGLDPFSVPIFPVVANYDKDTYKDLIDIVSTKVIIDIGSNSGKNRLSYVNPDRVNNALQKLGIKDFVIVRPKNPSQKWEPIPMDGETIVCPDLLSYFTVVEHAKIFITISNGGYWVASALRRDQKKTIHLEIDGCEMGYPSWMTMPFERITC